MKNLLKIALLFTLASGTMFAMDLNNNNNNNTSGQEAQILYNQIVTDLSQGTINQQLENFDYSTLLEFCYAINQDQNTDTACVTLTNWLQAFDTEVLYLIMQHALEQKQINLAINFYAMVLQQVQNKTAVLEQLASFIAQGIINHDHYSCQELSQLIIMFDENTEIHNLMNKTIQQKLKNFEVQGGFSGNFLEKQQGFQTINEVDHEVDTAIENALENQNKQNIQRIQELYTKYEKNPVQGPKLFEAIKKLSKLLQKTTRCHKTSRELTFNGIKTTEDVFKCSSTLNFLIEEFPNDTEFELDLDCSQEELETILELIQSYVDENTQKLSSILEKLSLNELFFYCNKMHYLDISGLLNYVIDSCTNRLKTFSQDELSRLLNSGDLNCLDKFCQKKIINFIFNRINCVSANNNNNNKMIPYKGYQPENLKNKIGDAYCEILGTDIWNYIALLAIRSFNSFTNKLQIIAGLSRTNKNFNKLTEELIKKVNKDSQQIFWDTFFEKLIPEDFKKGLDFKTWFFNTGIKLPSKESFEIGNNIIVYLLKKDDVLKNSYHDDLFLRHPWQKKQVGYLQYKLGLEALELEKRKEENLNLYYQYKLLHSIYFNEIEQLKDLLQIFKEKTLSLDFRITQPISTGSILLNSQPSHYFFYRKKNNKKSITPLELAIINNNAKAIELLLQEKDINIYCNTDFLLDSKGDPSPLTFVLRHCSDTIVKLFIKKIFDNHIDKFLAEQDGDSAYNIFYNYMYYSKKYIDPDPDSDDEFNNDTYYDFYARLFDDSNFENFFLELWQQHKLCSDLKQAILQNNSEKIQEFIAQGANVNSFGDNQPSNHTPLSLALENGCVNVITILLKNGLDISGLNIQLYQKAQTHLQSKSNLSELEQKQLTCLKPILEKIENSNKQTTKKAKIEKQ